VEKEQWENKKNWLNHRLFVLSLVINQFVCLSIFCFWPVFWFPFTHLYFYYKDLLVLKVGFNVLFVFLINDLMHFY